MSGTDVESILAKFEAAFARSKSINLRDFLPPADSADFKEVAVELVRVDMELSWAKGIHKSIGDYQRLLPEIMDDGRCLDSIAYEEYRLRAANGDDVTPHDYESKYGLRTWHWPVLNRRTKLLSREDSGDSGSNLNEAGTPVVNATIPDLAARMETSLLTHPATVESALHRRLRFISLAIGITLAYLAFLAWLSPDRKVGLFLGSTWLIWVNAIALAMTTASAAVLWNLRMIPLRYLRVLELVLFWTVLIELTSGLYSDLFIDHELAEPAAEGQHSLFHYASSWSLPFFALIVAYGILVPSGWQRCLLNVSLMALAPVIVCTLAAIQYRLLSLTFFSSFLLQLALWMAIGAAIAVYGVSRLQLHEYRLALHGKLGQYRLVRQLASGGMGEVYLAEHTRLQRRCAIKLIHPKWSRHWQLMARFECEVHVLAGLSHPNVVQILDYGVTGDGVFYYVMEYLEGSTLEHHVRDHGPLPWMKTVDVIAQIADALDVVHAGGIVHRDVKPGNIFLVPSGRSHTPKLLDFGLVKAVSVSNVRQDLTEIGEVIGTPAYMSPEQAAGRNVDHRTDIYSLGAVAWFALTGSPVFPRETIAETLAAHIASRPVLNMKADGVPPHLMDILLRCLSKDSGSRYQSAAQLAEDLRGLLVSKPARDPGDHEAPNGSP